MSNPEIRGLIDALRLEDEQLYALLTLNELEAEIPSDDLLPLLLSPNYFIRKMSLETMARTVNVKDVAIIGPYIVPLIADENENVRAAAAETLGVLAYVPAVSRLSSLLPNEESVYVRCCVAEALGDIGDAHAVSVLEKVLYDEDEQVQAYVIRSLGLLAHASFDRVFAKFLEQDGLSTELHIEVACANYRIGGKGGLHQMLTVLEQIIDIDNLDRMLSNINDFLDRKRPPTLQNDADQLWSALEAVKGRFVEREITITRIQMVLGQERMVTPERIHELSRMIENGEPSKQIAAVKELESFHVTETVPQILLLLHAANDALREQAAHSIGRLASPGVDEIGMELMALLNDATDLVRYEAAESLGILHYTPAKEALQRIMLDDTDWLARIAAIEALDAFTERTLLTNFQVMFERFRGDDSEEALLLQKSAAEAITHLTTHEDIALLQHDLADATERPVVSAVFLGSLYALKVPGSFEQLLELLTHMQREVDILFALKCIFRLTEGDPPALLPADITPLLEVLSQLKGQALTKHFFQSTVRVDRLQQRLQLVRSGEIIPVRGRDAYCC